jgi:uncharacterized protein YutE (UPF0331/DUF86 family)
MKQWVEFEKTLLEASRALGKEGNDYVVSRNLINQLSTLDPESKKKLEWIRMLRNRAVHGHGEIEINEMREATVMLKQILKNVRAAKK